MAGVEDQTARAERREGWEGSDRSIDETRPRLIVRGIAVMGAIEVKHGRADSLKAASASS